ncbi:MAG: O-antigen ligase family protein [Paludibacteraceae bacterium]|nr:O-antigen ligase family protein [Paludibacteraceae bacterium]
MNRYQEIVGKINYGLFLTVVALLPFPQIALRITCVLWIVAWALEGRWLSRPKSLRENPMAIPFILFGVWYAWQALSWFWAGDSGRWAWQMERYLTFVLMVPVGIWGVNRHYHWRTAGKVLVWTCVLAIPLYVGIATLFYHHPELPQHIHWEKPWDYSHQTWFPFFADNISRMKHRLFFSSVELFGMVMAAQLYKDRKWLAALLILTMLTGILLTGSRQIIMTTTVLIAVGLLCEMPKPYRLRYGLGILLLGIVLGGGLLKLHPRMQNFDLSDITEMRQVEDDHDIRFNIWGTALQQPKDYLWYGLGAGQSKEYIRSKFEEIGFSFLGTQDFHPHNQYLEVLMEMGVFGLLFFLLAWVSIPLCAKEKGRLTAILFLTVFAFNMFTDCMFAKFCGIGLWAVGLLFILLQSDAQRQE